MKQTILKIHPDDNVLVALTDLPVGQEITYGADTFTTIDPIPAKHKVAIHDIQADEDIIMYGVLVGKAQYEIKSGGVITTRNIRHAANSNLTESKHAASWQQPDVSAWKSRTFNGYHRADGSVGTANYWLVIPMVFCENRNLEVLQEALVKPLGYGRKKTYETKAQQLINKVKSGGSIDEVLYTEINADDAASRESKVFPNVDGIKFLTHTGGCGGIRHDA